MAAEGRYAEGDTGGVPGRSGWRGVQRGGGDAGEHRRFGGSVDGLRRPAVHAGRAGGDADGSGRDAYAPGYVEDPGGGVRAHHQRPGAAVVPALDAGRRTGTRRCASTCESRTTTPRTRRATSSSCRCWRSTRGRLRYPPMRMERRRGIRREWRAYPICVL